MSNPEIDNYVAPVCRVCKQVITNLKYLVGIKGTASHIECVQRPSEFHLQDLIPPPDPVNPSHYVAQGSYSALHVVQKWGLGFCLGNALKYISRAGKKPGESEITDLKKAVWYIRRHIHELDSSEPDPAAPENQPA